MAFYVVRLGGDFMELPPAEHEYAVKTLTAAGLHLFGEVASMLHMNEAYRAQTHAAGFEDAD